MNLTISKNNLLIYTIDKLNIFFNDKKKIYQKDLSKIHNISLDRLEQCFKKINNNYYQTSNKVVFNHLNTDHFCSYLYFLSNTCYKKNINPIICQKIYYLNKILHSVDIFYEVNLPDIFLLIHPVGSVLGRAKYEDYFVVYQNCNVGSDKNKNPIFEKYVTLRPHSSVLGNCRISENSVIAAHSIILNRNIKKNTIYIGNPKSFYQLKNKSKYEAWK